MGVQYSTKSQCNYLKACNTVRFKSSQNYKENCRRKELGRKTMSMSEEENIFITSRYTITPKTSGGHGYPSGAVQ